MAFTIIMNHFAGIMLLMTCIGKGILFIGKMNPESMITGNINPIKESIIAVCCELEMVEINMPNESAEMINKILSKANKNTLPFIGILKTK
jgi:hypothetical protein